MQVYFCIFPSAFLCTAGIQCLVLGSLIQERCICTGASPGQDHKYDWGSGAPFMKGKAGRHETVQLKKSGLGENAINVLNSLK